MTMDTDKAVPSREVCSTCRFSFGDPTYYEHMIRCRRYPPTNVLNNGQRMVWPCVEQDAWCGEYQPALTPKGAPNA